MRPVKVRWDATLDAFDELLHQVPPDALRGLDVGCGEGETTRRLRSRVPSVLGIDQDEASIAAARSYGDDIHYVVGDLGSSQLKPVSFDVVTSAAVFCHRDLADALRTMADFVRPGGRLLVVGVARSASTIDLAHDAIDALRLRLHGAHHEVSTAALDLLPPPPTWEQAKADTLSALPDAIFRRLPYSRYTITWAPPGY